jgi:hypothetical protein
MLIILRLAVLPHKHPHELLDSAVKERVVDPFASKGDEHSTACLILRQVVFINERENFFSISTTCAFAQL